MEREVDSRTLLQLKKTKGGEKQSNFDSFEVTCRKQCLESL